MTKFSTMGENTKVYADYTLENKDLPWVRLSPLYNNYPKILTFEPSMKAITPSVNTL